MHCSADKLACRVTVLDCVGTEVSVMCVTHLLLLCVVFHLFRSLVTWRLSCVAL